jgi:A/G-specific adenine glycosylase
MGISIILQQWYEINKRDLPWRKTSSPYFIWLSEIILQQTRVMQGLDYYLKFTERYPHIEDLADAPLDEVLKLWQGLGYYTRARNLHATARTIASEMNGIFPSTYKGLLQLRGIGKYTAAAIASFAFRDPVAVVDGNVLRVLARVFGIDLSVSSIQGKDEYYRRAAQILDKENPHTHNQAMMELGALVCLPKSPQCHNCPLTAVCVAFNTGKTALLPVRSVKKPLRNRYFNYFFFVSQDYTWLIRRSQNDIWHSLYEFPLIETPVLCTLEDISVLNEWCDILGKAKAEQVGPARHYKHQLTHQTIHCSFYHFHTAEQPAFTGRSPIRIITGDLNRYAVPRLIEKYLTDLNKEK